MKFKSTLVLLATALFGMTAIHDQVNNDEQRVQQHARDDALDNGVRGHFGDFIDSHRPRETLVTGHRGDHHPEAESLEGEQDKIRVTKGIGELAEIFTRPQRDIHSL